MKKTLLVIGVTLLAAAVICFILSLWFRHMHGSVLDGSAGLYERLYRRFQMFLYWGIGLSVSGAALLLIRFIMNKSK